MNTGPGPINLSKHSSLWNLIKKGFYLEPKRVLLLLKVEEPNLVQFRTFYWQHFEDVVEKIDYTMFAIKYWHNVP